MRVAQNDKQMSSHLPVLLKAIQMTTGDVCELGAGFYSTPFLHWLCRERKLISYENNPDYFHFAKRFQTKNHRVRPMESIEFDRHWAIVFIDHEMDRRGVDAVKFTNADLIILHDTQPELQKAYGYDKVWSKFKFRRDFTDNRPHVSIVSNTIDVTNSQMVNTQDQTKWAEISKMFFVVGSTISIIALIFSPGPYNYLIPVIYIIACILNYVIYSNRKTTLFKDKLSKLLPYINRSKETLINKSRLIIEKAKEAHKKGMSKSIQLIKKYSLVKNTIRSWFL